MPVLGKLGLHGQRLSFQTAARLKPESSPFGLRDRIGGMLSGIDAPARVDIGRRYSSELRYIPQHVKIYEMGPRDGLQNESIPVPTATKIEFVNDLSRTGLRFIEATSFVSKQWVPQMGDADAVCGAMNRVDGVTYSALVPNMKGMDSAISAGLTEVAVFAAATDSFSRRNINCTVMDSLERFKPVLAAAKAHDIRVRGYVSCALGCPYEGHVAPDAVGFVAQSLLELGCYEVSLGDTIGVGTPSSVKRMLAAVKSHAPVHALAVHFHDTYGQGVANVLAALEEGVSTLDSSVAGLGGCPYAGRGATGNVSTEDVVYLLHGLGCSTGCDLDALVDAGDAICRAIGRPNRSKVAVARLGHRDTINMSGSEIERLTLAAQSSVGAEKAHSELAKLQARVRDARLALSWPEAPFLSVHLPASPRTAILPTGEGQPLDDTQGGVGQSAPNTAWG